MKIVYCRKTEQVPRNVLENSSMHDSGKVTKHTLNIIPQDV